MVNLRPLWNLLPFLGKIADPNHGVYENIIMSPYFTSFLQKLLLGWPPRLLRLFHLFHPCPKDGTPSHGWCLLGRQRVGLKWVAVEWSGFAPSGRPSGALDLKYHRIHVVDTFPYQGGGETVSLMIKNGSP